MKIIIKNADQYIAFLGGVCGEIDSIRMLSNSPFSEHHIRKQLTMLTQNKVVRRHAYAEDSRFGAKRVMRLTGIAGEELAGNLSPELGWHYNLMVGKKGQRYKGNKQHRERMRRLFTLCQMMYETGVPVDMLEHNFKNAGLEENVKEKGAFASFIKDKTIFDGEGELLNPKEILARAGTARTYFFTSKALSRMNLQKDERGKVMMARSFGMLMKGPTMYTVYCCGDYAEIWWEGIERQMLLLTEKYRSEVFGVPRGGEGAAIVYTPDRKVADEMFLPPKLIKNRINPTGVYGQGHVLPLTENHLDIRAMLMRDNWKEESGRFLLKENYTPGQLYDGTMNGYEVYNFLSNDMVHMSKCRQRIKTKPSTLLIHEWQEETVRRYFGEDVQLIKFNENEFAALIGAIEEAEEEFL